MKRDVFQAAINADDWYAQWLEQNAGFLPLLLNSYLKGQPGWLPENRCIRASDTSQGRFISIEQYHYKWIYLLKPRYQAQTIPWFTALIDRIEKVGGHSHLENSDGISKAEHSFLVIDLPVGLYLDFYFGRTLRFDLKQIEYVDLGNI